MRPHCVYGRNDDHHATKSFIHCLHALLRTHPFRTTTIHIDTRPSRAFRSHYPCPRRLAYAMRILALILSTLAYSASFANALLRIGDVFDIQPGSRIDGGCAAFYARGDPNSYMNLWWSQILSMHAQAIASLTAEEYERSVRTQKLLAAMFGIQARVDSQGWSRDPDPNTIDGYRLWKVRKHFSIMWDFMNTPGDARYKAKLFCEGSYWHQQFENSPIYDAFGNKVLRDRNDPSKGFRTLGEQERMHGRGANLDLYWYFHSSTHTEYPTPEGATTDHKYMIWQRAGATNPDARSPWPVDEKTGSTHPCKWDIDPLGMVADGGFLNIGAPYPEGSYAHLILCTRSPMFSSGRDYFDLSPQPVGKRLADMEINSMTLYHEVVHLALGTRNSRDAILRRPKLDHNGVVHPQWPWNVNSWENTGRIALAGNEMLHVALYDRAINDYGSERQWDNLEALGNPESIVWYSYANYLLNKVGDDWSQGIIVDPLVRPPPFNPGKIAMQEPRISINETTLELIEHGVNITEILERWSLEDEKYAMGPMTEEIARMF
ncbi:hypothetical protein HII31_06547 [Pseudocercospora fuligena]|uniref:Uncharacterized protein n=1 Tax=Pseudocercospora fuligena TaxID=685502 RepID=A0A8H6RJG2_9PEZI|nr:hypothetical protein HII31_06547 [Pseudocercospora fuligena]